MKHLFFLVLFFCLQLPLYAEKVVVFETPQPNARSLMADKKLFQETGVKERLIIENHPLVYFHEMKEVKTASGFSGYIREDLTVTDQGQVVRDRIFPWEKATMGVLALLAMITIIIRMIRDGAKDWHYLALPLLLRIALVSLTLYRWDCVHTIAADENGYFETIHDMLNGRWNNQWRFTVGTGFFYLPFIKLLNAQKFYDIVPYFNLFSAYVIAPSILAAGYLILKKLGVSSKKSCAVMLIWAILPFVLFHIEDWSIWKFQHLFLFPTLFSKFNRLLFYGFCINSGYNAMSDTPGLMVVMWSFYFALAMPGKLRYALLFGMLFGFACLIRINYILLAPAFAIILFNKFKESGRLLIKAALMSVGGFLAIFSIQMICNTLQFGSPLTFGYILHYTQNNVTDRPNAGFTWHTFSRLTFARYLLQSNLPVLSIGTAALWVMKPGSNRRILVWMGVPLLLFFSGYSHTFCDARRFIFPAFAAFLMAIPLAAEVWDKLSWWMRIQIFFILGVMVCVTTPVNANWKHLQLLIGDGIFLKIMAIAVPLAILFTIFQLGKQKKFAAAIFMLLSGLFFYLPSEFLGTAMLLLLLWSSGADHLAGILIDKVRLKLWSQRVQSEPDR